MDKPPEPKRLVFGVAHTAEFLDKWLAENETEINELIASGVFDSNEESTRSRPSESDCAHDSSVTMEAAPYV